MILSELILSKISEKIQSFRPALCGGASLAEKSQKILFGRFL
jgi:long-subunit acyl-CoA synthetase (AMP-forming)